MFDWLQHTDPMRLTAYATIAVAFVGGVSIVANAFLAWQARESAKAARDGVGMQLEELGILKQQAKLAQDQFTAARDAARPRLRPTPVHPGDLYIDGMVAYVHGSEPAYDIHVFIRGPSEPGAGWGVHVSRIAFIGAADREQAYKAIPASAQEQEAVQSLFPEFFTADLGELDYWVGLTWSRLDGSTDKFAEKQTLPPGPMARWV